MKKLIVCAMALACSLAFAQSDDGEDKKGGGLSLSEIQKNAGIGGVLSNASPEDLKRAEENARSAVKSITEAYERSLPVKAAEYAAPRRRADQIANDAIQAERDKALEFLGIDPDSESAVYVFLSWSMPVDLLRKYVIDGMWSGATLYFKGLPPGKDLATFVTKDLRSLAYGKRAANLAIDPRMFEAFDVTTAPTIVYTTSRDQFKCHGVTTIPFEAGDKNLSYQGCVKVDDDLYWKMSGSVSTSYALTTFMESGAAGVKPYVDAISKGFAEGIPPGKAQTPYAGKWEDALSPEDLEVNRKFDERVKAYQAEQAKAAEAKRQAEAATTKP